jgi:DNA primase
MEWNIPGLGQVETLRTEENRVKGGTEHICICPNTNCNKAKFSINEDTLIYRCWVCGVSGRLSNKEPTEKGKRKPRKPVPKVSDIDPDVIDEYIDILVKSLDHTAPQVKAYLANKKIDLKYATGKFKVGFSHDKPDYPDNKIAETLGLAKNNSGKWANRFYNRLVIPVSRNGKWIYVVGRGLGPQAKPKFLNMNGPAHLFNADDLEEAREVYHCEGAPDAIAVKHSDNTLSVVAQLGAARTFDPSVYKGKKVHLCFDDDSDNDNVDAGGIAFKKACALLEDAGIEFDKVDLPKGKDIAEHLAGGGSITLVPAIEEAEVEKTEATDRSELVYLRTEENLIVFGYGRGKEYSMMIGVSNVQERKQTLHVKLDIAFDTRWTTTGTVNLASLQNRSAFSKGLYKDYDSHLPDDAEPAITEAELKSILNDLHTGVRQQLEENKESAAKPTEYVPSEEELIKARKYLAEPQLLFRVKNALRRQKIVGEEVNKLLLYLIFTSRIMPKPISCIIKGLSSSGKTHLMKQVMTLIPPEDVMLIQDATAKSFYYLDEFALVHKMVVIGEMHGSDDSSYTIREAQDGASDGDLIIQTVEKDPDTNQMVTRKKTVKGPSGFITSTTNPEIHPENETRNFSIFVEINPEKVRETGVILEEKYLGTGNPLPPEEVIMLHNVQRALECGLRVRIPYVKALLDAFPSSPARVMRDRERFLTILECITVLHQLTPGRKRIEENEERILESNLCDYHIAYSLLNEILAQTLHELPPKSKDIYDEIVELKQEWTLRRLGMAEKEQETMFDDSETPTNIDDSGEFYCTYKEIAERMDMRPEEARRWSKSLRDKGYLAYQDKGGGRGKESHLYPIDKDFYQSFLPTVEEIAERYQLWGELVYDPITGEERVINNVEEEISDVEL